MKMGRLAAVCMRATNSGEGVSEVISQATPTPCIHVPTLEAIEAIQIERKSALRSGLQADTPGSGRLASLRRAGAVEAWGFFTGTYLLMADNAMRHIRLFQEGNFFLG